MDAFAGQAFRELAVFEEIPHRLAEHIPSNVHHVVVQGHVKGIVRGRIDGTPIVHQRPLN